jgi:hypothetical protein
MVRTQHAFILDHLITPDSVGPEISRLPIYYLLPLASQTSPRVYVYIYIKKILLSMCVGVHKWTFLGCFLCNQKVCYVSENIKVVHTLYFTKSAKLAHRKASLFYQGCLIAERAFDEMSTEEQAV